MNDLKLLMDTFHRVEFTGTWRRLFSRVKKHIIWGVLKSVTGMQVENLQLYPFCICSPSITPVIFLFYHTCKFLIIQGLYTHSGVTVLLKFFQPPQIKKVLPTTANQPAFASSSWVMNNVLKALLLWNKGNLVRSRIDLSYRYFSIII